MKIEHENDNIPVTYCKHCLSLKIRILGEDTDFCDECSSTEMGKALIKDWEKLFEAKYNKTFNQHIDEKRGIKKRRSYYGGDYSNKDEL